MKGKILQLIFRETKAYLCKEKAFSLIELELHNMITHFPCPAFWTLQVIETFPAEKRIHVEILNYNQGNTKISEFQKAHLSELSKYEKLTFCSVDTKGVYFSAKKSEDKDKNIFIPKAEKLIRIEIPKIVFENKIPIPATVEPVITTEIEEFAIDFNDTRIMLGYIIFKAYVKKRKQSLEFKIYNDNLLPEFDNIKFWFSKRLKTKKFKVKAVFTLINQKLTEWTATSNEINLINNELIEGVKLQRTLEVAKTFRPKEISKALFTSDDIYSLENKNDLFGNVFKQTENDILDIFLENSNVRNKKELMYLSGKIHSVNYRIRFSNHPNFGFIFLYEGELNNHFIWELLNTNATYIWTIEKERLSIELQYKRIENTINTILNISREPYKRAFKNKTIDTDIVFNPISHKDKTSDFIDNFPRWKQKINDLMT